ncbi:ABC transporter permease [Gephyromycinifex aptenodytis]|uniref:ABC transporter permease n=1 Tax=Gephyromycinifex aptenodytis TaxID=2716227 RepID=UPI001445929E|nr:FtsX-like permease family protein [Gephyromycinifex aptenodytis]
MNKRKMFVRIVLSSIMRRRSRVLIAMVAVAIGATTLASLAMITIDVPRQMAREMRSYGANMVVLPKGDHDSFPPAVLDEIKGDLPDTILIGSVGLEYQPITINGLPYVAAGTSLKAAREINPYWYVDGQWPTKPGQVLIGREIARATDVKVGDSLTLTQLIGESPSAPPAEPDTLEAKGHAADGHAADGHAAHMAAPGQLTNEGGKPIAPPDKKLKDAAPGGGADMRELKVVITGVLETGGSEDGFVYLESADLAELTGKPYQLTVAELSIAPKEESIEALATRLTTAHPQINAEPVTRLTHSDANVLEMLRSLMAIISLIVLALIMIGVSTTMMAVVTERRNEIGLRKALGADNRSIVGEFLGEAVVLGLVGGALGAAMGYGLAQVISLNVFHRTVAFQPLVVIATVLVSVLISTLASLFPVRRAIDIDPALVLRGE